MSEQKKVEKSGGQALLVLFPEPRWRQYRGKGGLETVPDTLLNEVRALFSSISEPFWFGGGFSLGKVWKSYKTRSKTNQNAKSDRRKTSPDVEPVSKAFSTLLFRSGDRDLPVRASQVPLRFTMRFQHSGKKIRKKKKNVMPLFPSYGLTVPVFEKPAILPFSERKSPSRDFVAQEASGSKDFSGSLS